MRGVVLRHTPKKSEQHNVTTPPESREAAAAAGLRYVTDKTPGFRRVRAGKGFRYVTPDGATVREERAFNPRLGDAKTEAQFVEIMAHLGLPPPAKLAVAVPANLRGGL